MEPGARPSKDKLSPTKGSDGIWRLDRVRHRAFSGRYVRSSGSGATRKECLEDWEANFEANRRKGSVRTKPRRRQFELTDKMSVVFAYYAEHERRRVVAGKITQQTCDSYLRAIFKADGPRADPNAIKLDEELGDLTIGEVGKPAFLADYLDDVAECYPGVAVTHYVILRGVFQILTLAGLFDYSPMTPVPKPPAGKGNQRALTANERAEFFDLIPKRLKRAKYFRPLCLTLLGTGIRPGEGFGLIWRDIEGLDDETVENAVIHVYATVIKPKGRGKAFRQLRRKRGPGYYVTAPKWLTDELRAWKRVTEPKSDDLPVFLSSNGNMVAPGTAESALSAVRADTSLEWVTLGNFRDTVATHITGKTADPARASAQLGHSEGSSVAKRHYIDPDGYIRQAVDNADVLEDLAPAKVGTKLEFSLVSA